MGCAHFQPKMDLSPWMEQLRDPNTGTLQINLKKKSLHILYIFDSGISGTKLYPGGTGQGTGQPAGWNTGLSRRWPLPTAASPGPLSHISLTPQAHKPPRKKPFGQHPTCRAVTAVPSRLLREGWRFPDTPVTCRELTAPVWAHLGPCCGH